MTRLDTFVPTGTVRRHFETNDTEEGTREQTLERTLVAIADIADYEHFDPAIVWTAKRLVDNEEGLDGQTRLKATLTTLAFLIASGEGSTQLPLKAPDHLDAILERLQERLASVRGDDEARRESSVPTETLKTAEDTLADLREIGNSGVGISLEALSTLAARVVPETIEKEEEQEQEQEQERIAALPYRPLLFVGDDGGEPATLTSERMLRKEWSLASDFAAQSRVELADLPELPGRAIPDAIAALKADPVRFKSGEKDNGWEAQRFNVEQARAVVRATRKPLTLVTGGPGTGKTTIIVSILRMLVRLGVDPARVALAAPTGKAAYRMRESIDSQLQSIEELPPPDADLRRGLAEARTLHRLLGYSPSSDRFWRNATNPVDADVVICDESSMIDVELMHALLDALPGDCRLMLVGDANQLPSVAGGAVFRDIVADGSGDDPEEHALIEALSGQAPADTDEDEPDDHPFAPHTVKLKKSYRMESDDKDGAAILKLAHSIRDCEDPNDATLAERIGPPSALDEHDTYGGVTRLSADTKLHDFADRWFDRFVTLFAELPEKSDETGETDATHDSETSASPRHSEKSRTRAGRSFRVKKDQNSEFTEAACEDLDSIFRHYENARMLCVTQAFKTGARALNRRMHERFLQQAPQKSDDAFQYLEPVIVQQNNYDFGVFNGDQGVVVHVQDEDDDRNKFVVFRRADGGFRRIHISHIKHQLEHGYATSIHKSQGSEFDHVAVVLPEEPMPLLTKELLYTGVTRAATSVTVFDPEELLEVGAANPVERFTGLRAELERRVEGESGS